MKRSDIEKLGLTKENLEKAGLPEDLPDQIFALHGKDIEAFKTKVETAEGERDALQGQLKEAGDKIAEMAKIDPDKLQATANEWKAKAEEAEKKAKEAAEDNEKKLAALKFDHALEAKLNEAGAQDVVSVRAHLKVDDLKLNDDGEIVGLKEQLDKVRETRDYLFSDGKEAPEFVSGSQQINGAKPTTFADAIGQKLNQNKKD